MTRQVPGTERSALDQYDQELALGHGYLLCMGAT
jgi:hypothetical protein